MTIKKNNIRQILEELLSKYIYYDAIEHIDVDDEENDKRTKEMVKESTNKILLALKVEMVGCVPKNKDSMVGEFYPITGEDKYNIGYNQAITETLSRIEKKFKENREMPKDEEGHYFETPEVLMPKHEEVIRVLKNVEHKIRNSEGDTFILLEMNNALSSAIETLKRIDVEKLSQFMGEFNNESKETFLVEAQSIVQFLLKGE